MSSPAAMGGRTLRLYKRVGQRQSAFRDWRYSGISSNFSSGDYGDFTFGYPQYNPPSVSYPADAPYATAVGGVSLALNADNSIAWQDGWGTNEILLAESGFVPDPPESFGFDFGAGGGPSGYFAKPKYQKKLAGKFRQLPDISWLADPFTGVVILISIPGQLPEQYGKSTEAPASLPHSSPGSGRSQTRKPRPEVERRSVRLRPMFTHCRRERSSTSFPRPQKLTSRQAFRSQPPPPPSTLRRKWPGSPDHLSMRSGTIPLRGHRAGHYIRYRFRPESEEGLGQRDRRGNSECASVRRFLLRK